MSNLQRWKFAGFGILSGLALNAGCTEFSHFGQISDRDSAFAINDVKIEQQQADGRWKVLGYSDGKGKWNIFKNQIHGAGRIRLSKPGYETVMMNESDFLQQVSIVMRGSGGAEFGRDYGETGGSEDRPRR